LQNNMQETTLFSTQCSQGVLSLFSKSLKLPSKGKNGGPCVTTKFCLKQKTARDVWHLLLEFYCFKILLSSTQANCLQKFLLLSPALPVSGKIFKMLVWGPVYNHLSLFSILFSISKKNFQRKNYSSLLRQIFSLTQDTDSPGAVQPPRRAPPQEDS